MLVGKICRLCNEHGVYVVEKETDHTMKHRFLQQ